MNNIYILFAYMAVFILLGLRDCRRNHSFEDFTLAGRSRGTLAVTLSILATAIGASSTMGVSSMAHKVGFPAFWWLGAGVVGLLLQAFFLTKKVRSSGAKTLPDLARITIDPTAGIMVAMVIVVAWIGIIAAQFVAAARIMQSMAPGFSFESHLIIGALVIMLYAVMGGQYAVLKTDSIQFGILASSILIALCMLYSDAFVPVNIELLNSNFKGSNLAYFMVFIGGSFFIGPDMFSRVFTARSENHARRAVIISAVLLLLMSLAIVGIGLWTGSQGLDIGKDNPFTYVIKHSLNPGIALFLSLGILSAIISSGDTCLVTVSSILEYDILGETRVSIQRILLFITGLLALIIALWWRDIIKLLISAYSIYTAGIVPPLGMALLFSGKRKIRHSFMSAAILMGGSLGICSSILSIKYLAFVGFFVSLVFSFLAVFLPANGRDS